MPKKNSAPAAIVSAARGLNKVGAIGKVTLRTFDPESIPPPASLTPSEIQAIRKKEGLSQPVFARYLGISESTLEKWESGNKSPRGMALKLLSVVKKKWSRYSKLITIPRLER